MTLATRRIGIPKAEVASWTCKALRDSARGAPCMFDTPWCNHNDETTVWVHSDRVRDGNGQGCKGHDFFGAYGCAGCHRWHGEGRGWKTREERDEVFDLAHRKSWCFILETNRVKFWR